MLCIETLRDEPGGLSLQDLALRTGYVKSSIHRILRSLKRHGYIEQDGSGESTVLACSSSVGAPSLAAPVFDSRVRVWGSISVGVPKVRFSPAFAEDIALYLVDACRRLSEKLGAAGHIHPHHGEYTLIEDTNQPILSFQGRLI